MLEPQPLLRGEGPFPLVLLASSGSLLSGVFAHASPVSSSAFTTYFNEMMTQLQTFPSFHSVSLER